MAVARLSVRGKFKTTGRTTMQSALVKTARAGE